MKPEMNSVEREYCSWLMSKVNDSTNWICGHEELFKILFSVPFIYHKQMDGNRALDGINLRYRFGRERFKMDAEIAGGLDYRDCSVLEMMIAIALNLEERIMDNYLYGDRTSKWFRYMLFSLGLDDATTTNESIDYISVMHILNNFMSGNYDKNGNGGLFVLQNPKCDVRDMEIWAQANWYLTENMTFQF